MGNVDVNFLAVTSAQYNVIFGVGGLSCILSFFGSLSIIALVYKSAKRPSATFERMMLGICVADVLGTLANFLQPFLLPAYTRLPYAIGNQATCSLLGFMFHVLLASSVYSAELSFFFWTSIQRGQHARAIRKHSLETWMHLFPWLAALVVSLAALGLNTLNPSPVLGICMAACTIDPTTWECTSTVWWSTALRLTAVAIPLSAAAIGIWFLTRLHKKVKEQESRNSQYCFSGNSSHLQTARRLETTRMKSTFTQALSYSFAFLNSFFAVSVAAIGREVFYNFLGVRSSWLYFCVQIYVYAMFPLQGFLNWLVFVRPRVLRWRSACQDKSLIWCLWQTVLGRHPPTTDRTRHSKFCVEVCNEQDTPQTNNTVQRSESLDKGSNYSVHHQGVAEVESDTNSSTPNLCRN